MCSDSARHWFQDICPPISQTVLKNFIKINLIIECPEEILIKLLIVLRKNINNGPQNTTRKTKNINNGPQNTTQKTKNINNGPQNTTQKTKNINNGPQNTTQKTTNINNGPQNTTQKTKI
jgi:chemotaxis regulatin CheY-phosphate phosphatase CheZ